MLDFNRELADLQSLLKRVDVPHQWRTSYSFTDGDACHVHLDVRLGIRSQAHARPTGASFEAADINLHLKIGGEGSLHDVVEASAQVVVDGIGSDGQEIRCALHFDRHDPLQESKDLHALYHWQLGGDKLDGFDVKGMLVLEGPRFPSHPLDPVLLVDFVLGHFHGEKRAELMDLPGNNRYRELLYESQCRFIAPFFSELAAALVADPFAKNHFWPSLCGPA